MFEWLYLQNLEKQGFSTSAETEKDSVIFTKKEKL